MGALAPDSPRSIADPSLSKPPLPPAPTGSERGQVAATGRVDPAARWLNVFRLGSEQSDPPPLPAEGSLERWQLLQELGRSASDLGPWLAGLASGTLAPEVDLLVALAGRVDQGDAERLLVLAADFGLPLLLQALEQALPVLPAATRAVWLEPLLAQAPDEPGWLALLGAFQDPRVAQRLRQALARSLDAPLLERLGHQRQGEDGALLLTISLAPGPRALRHGALEGLALGLSAWPLGPLEAGLAALAADLDPALAAKAVDLLARLPHGQRQLRRLAQRPLAAPVQGRLQRRLRRAPLVLVVHGRSGGLIPEELQDWARELEQRRGAPVLLQALTSGAPDPDPAFWAGAHRAGTVGLVPLLLLPGGHVRKDLPAIARAWRTRLGPGPAIALQRYPFLGAWPAWQLLLAGQLADRQGFGAIHWLHHPLEGPLAQRYLAHLGAVLGSAGLATPYTAALADLVLPVDRPDPGTVAVLPLTLASNRLTDTLDAGRRGALQPGQARPPQPLPPLLQQPAIRQFLLTALEALP